MEGKRKIIYIAGLGRSGSFIINDILGQVSGFFSAGEARDVWVGGSDQPCPCGQAFRDCETWVRIFLTAFGRDPASMDYDEVLRMAQRTDRLKHLWWLTSATGRRLADRWGTLSNYLDITKRLYAAIFSVSGAKVVIDSSKAPSHAYILEMTELADVYIVHLVRDPRACAYGWIRPREGKWPPRSLLRAAMEWNANNLACEWLWRKHKDRYLRISYEDFVECPRVVMQSILDFADEGQAELPFESERLVDLRPLHDYGGPPGRYTGRIEIKSDTNWLAKMRLGQKLGVTVMTTPTLLYYRYPFNFLARRQTPATPAASRGT